MGEQGDSREVPSVSKYSSPIRVLHGILGNCKHGEHLCINYGSANGIEIERGMVFYVMSYLVQTQYNTHKWHIEILNEIIPVA